jgi:heavy metal sensor kinase
MRRLKSLRFRLSAWYFLSLLAVLAALAAGSWFAMHLSLENAVDEVLADRFSSFAESLQHEAAEREDLAATLARYSTGASRPRLFRVLDQSGKTLFQSEALAEVLGAAQFTPPRTDRHNQIAFRNAVRAGQPVVRLASRAVTLPQGAVVLEVAEPMDLYNHALRKYGTLMLLWIAALIVPATMIGFWMSGRALAPIGRIIRTARAIDASNLSARLDLPPTDDELRRLSETLNGMLARIEDSVNRIRQFTADASHELRAPLTLIHTAAEYSLRRPRTREELEDAMRRILREATRTSQLVTHLLALARADAGAESHACVPVDLTALADSLRERAGMLAAPKSIELAFEGPGQRCWVNGDDTQLTGLLMIVLDNAIKYTPEGGRVTVSMSPGAEKCTIAVRDTGPGIAAEDLPRVFDRFWRADAVRSRENGGAGLGLSIARAIAERHGGSIDAESTLGAGSTFTITLPCVPGPSRLERQSRGISPLTQNP